MRTKSKNIALIFLFIIMFSAVFFGCSSSHEHSFGAWEKFNENEHRQACECGYTEYTNHTMDSGKCSSCEAIDLSSTDYFKGNIFQIYTKNLGKEIIGFGSGFVLNEDGYFITNSHVMEGSYYASALFEIPNKETGESFTVLDVFMVVYDNPDKDLFIGKINNYSSISSYYKEFNISQEHSLSEKTYSIGYPNATPYMEVNQGKVVADSTSLIDKLNGVEYICSTSFIAPGSSGGALFNSDFELIGITTKGATKENGDFVCGYSISSFNFSNYVANMSNYNLSTLTSHMHPNESEYIKFFNALPKQEDFIKSVEDELVTYTLTYTEEGTNNESISYVRTYSIKFNCNMEMYFYEEIYWSDGDRRTQEFSGYWSPTTHFSDFQYDFLYTYADKTYYNIFSDEIYYSENIDLTLNKYTLTKSYSIDITDGDISYAKEQFNYFYCWVLRIWDLRNES